MIPVKEQEKVEQLQSEMQALSIPEGMSYKLPPPTFKKLNGEFLNYETRKRIWTKFRIDSHFSNPQGSTQGGFITACFDDTFGPLGVVSCGRPVVSIDLNTQYIRPVPLNEDFYIVTTVISRSRSTIFQTAEALNAHGKLLAKASTNQLIMR